MAATLLAAACGSEPANTLEAAANNTTSTDQADQGQTDREDGGSAEATPAEDSDAADDQSDGADDSAATDGADEDEQAPIQHLFPNLSTVNVADGSTINLADELAGGDTPVLLWFYAPH